MVRSHTEWGSRSKSTGGHVIGRQSSGCTTETGTRPGDQGGRVSRGCCIRRKQERNEFKKAKFSICWQKALLTST